MAAFCVRKPLPTNLPVFQGCQELRFDFYVCETGVDGRLRD